MSSRNRYFTPEERVNARALYAALCRVKERIAEASVSELRNAMESQLAASPGVRVDYAEIVDPETLLPVHALDRGALVAVAAWVGGTRLIDNLLLPPRSGSAGEGLP